MSPLRLWADQFAGGGKLIGALALLAAAALAGGWLTGVVKEREIAQLKESHAAAWGIAEREARRRLDEAQTRGDALTTDLHAANRAALRLQEELDEQIAVATQGRACLDAAALRVLDRAPGIAAPRLPAAAGRAVAAGGADAAADPARAAGGGDASVATDTDVARWALDAGRQYDECARRLGALIDWHGPAPQQQERARPWN